VDVLAILIEKDWYDHPQLLNVITDDWMIALSSAAKVKYIPVAEGFFKTLVENGMTGHQRENSWRKYYAPCFWPKFKIRGSCWRR
jgi:hypothetical protein